MTAISARKIAERMARGRSFWRRLPAAYGLAPIRVSPDAALRHLLPGEQWLDPMLLRLCDEHVTPNSVVWDIGANLGILSVVAAAKGASVLAVEPDPWLFGLIQETAKHPQNEGRRITPLCAALAALPGTAMLMIAERGRAANYLEAYGGRESASGARAGVLTPVLTLDILLQSQVAPTLLKLDVEGAELDVLRGGEKLLAQSRPTILIEISDTGLPEAIRLLRPLGYRFIDYETKAEILGDQGAAGITLFNILALPHG